MHRVRRTEEEEDKGALKKKRADAKTVLFCPYTAGGELAKQLREAEENMERTTGYRMITWEKRC